MPTRLIPLNIKGSNEDENVSLRTAPHTAIVEPPLTERSEERRVGKEC